MKNFDESLVTVDVLQEPVKWIAAMERKTGADRADLQDYAKRRELWHYTQMAPTDGQYREAVDMALCYLLDMEHVR
jgi:hypothetical protein